MRPRPALPTASTAQDRSRRCHPRCCGGHGGARGMPARARRRPRSHSVPARHGPGRPAHAQTRRSPANLAQHRLWRRPRTSSRRAMLAVILDDAGYSLEELQPFLDLPGPLTVAVLPNLPHSAEAARRVLAAGKDLILHCPMEADGGEDPGPGRASGSECPKQRSTGSWRRLSPRSRGHAE